MSRADTATADIVGKTENGSLTAYDVLIAGAEYTQAEFSIGGAVAKDLPKDLTTGYSYFNSLVAINEYVTDDVQRYNQENRHTECVTHLCRDTP